MINYVRTLYYAAIYADCAWIAGGRDQYQTYNTIIFFNFSEPQIAPVILSSNWIYPEARRNHGMYLINTKILIFGGIGANG